MADENIGRSGLPSAALFSSAAERDLKLVLADDNRDMNVLNELAGLAADLPI